MTAITHGRDRFAGVRSALADGIAQLKSPTGRAILTGVNAAIATLNAVHGRWIIAIAFAIIAISQAVKAAE